MGLLFGVIAICLLAAAAWRDFAARIIPDWACGGVALCGAAERALHGPVALASSCALASALLAMLLVPFRAGALGGGDVKLAVSLTLGLSPLAVGPFLMTTGLAGGVLGGCYLTLYLAWRGRIESPARGRVFWRVLAAERRRIARKGPLPYGIAIAAAGVLAQCNAQGWSGL